MCDEDDKGMLTSGGGRSDRRSWTSDADCDRHLHFGILCAACPSTSSLGLWLLHQQQHPDIVSSGTSLVILAIFIAKTKNNGVMTVTMVMLMIHDE